MHKNKFVSFILVFALSLNQIHVLASINNSFQYNIEINLGKNDIGVDWVKSFNQSDFRDVKKIIATNDEGILVAVSVSEGISVNKFNNMGILEWNKTFNYYWSGLRSPLPILTNTSNGDFIITALNISQSDVINLWIARFNLIGEKIWEKNIPFTN